MAPDQDAIEQAIERARTSGALPSPRCWLLVGRFQREGQEFLVGVRPVPVRRQRPLSRREAEVLHLVGRGSSNKDISYELRLAWSTVRVLLHRAARKLGCAGRRELEAWARIRAESAAGEVTR